MPSSSVPRVKAHSYLTLHYRLASLQGDDIISTFKDSPATLQMGTGQLSPQLEAALLGLEEGSHTTKELTPEQAFGVRNPDLVRRVSLATLKENSASSAQYAAGDIVEFAAPSGGKFTGVLQSIDDEGAWFDFNHPLAGKVVLFETKIIGIL